MILAFWPVVLICFGSGGLLVGRASHRSSFTVHKLGGVVMRYDLDWQERDAMETAVGLVWELELPITLCRGARPIAVHWPTYMYSVEEIEREFARCPQLNVGVVLSRRSSLMEVVTNRGDGKQSERDFDELVDDVFMLTPTFTSRDGYHRLFMVDERLDSLGLTSLSFKSLSINIGTPRVARHCLVPPSLSQGVRREWLLHPDDTNGRFERLPDFAVDKIVTAYRDSGGLKRRPAMAIA